jgi:hypothetical protein
LNSLLKAVGAIALTAFNWARLIQKIYETDSLTCPGCSGKMMILSFIEVPEFIEKILKNLGFWDVKPRPLSVPS